MVKDFGTKVCGDQGKDAQDMYAAKTVVEESCAAAAESTAEHSSKATSHEFEGISLSYKLCLVISFSCISSQHF